MTDIFVSYSSDDRERVQPLVNALESRGWSVWWDREISPGSTWAQTIEKAIDSCRCVIVVWTEASAASEWVNTEAQEGLDRNILVPVFLEDVHVPLVFRRTQAANLRDWPRSQAARQEFERLARGVEDTLAASGEPGALAAELPQLKDTGTVSKTVGPLVKYVASSLIGILVLGAVYLLFTIGPPSKEPESELSSPGGTLIPLQASERSVAVLPFENLSDDPGDLSFSAGIHDEVISRLSRLSDLSVISRTAVMQYGGTTKTMGEIGEDLGVGSALEGSVRFSAGRARVTVQLIRASDDSHIWSRTFERNIENVFDAQTEIAVDIATAINAELSSTEEARLARRPTQNDDAWSLYLRAVSRGMNPDNWQNKMTWLARAVELDPDFGEAHGALAIYYYDMPSNGRDIDVTAVHADGQQHMARAQELAPESWFGLLSLARSHEVAFQWDDSLAVLEDVHQISPSTLWVAYHLTLMATGRHDEAIAYMKRKVREFPGDINRHIWLSAHYRYAGRFAEALEYAIRTEEIFANEFAVKRNLAWALLANGRNEAAARASGQMLELVPDTERRDVLYSAAYIAAMTGDRPAALEFLTEMEAADKETPINPIFFVIVNNALGNTDIALDFVDQLVETRNMLVTLLVSPGLERLHASPRFIAQLQRVRLRQ